MLFNHVAFHYAKSGWRKRVAMWWTWVSLGLATLPACGREDFAVDVRVVLRGIAWFAIILGAFAAVASLQVALTRPWIFEPTWANLARDAGSGWRP